MNNKTEHRYVQFIGSKVQLNLTLSKQKHSVSSYELYKVQSIPMIMRSTRVNCDNQEVESSGPGLWAKLQAEKVFQTLTQVGWRS